MVLLLATCLVATATSCGSLTKERVIYSRAYRAPEEIKGHLRLAQQTARVNVVGTDMVDDDFNSGGYFLIHESDLVGFVKAARRLAMSDEAGKLLSEEEVEKKITK